MRGSLVLHEEVTDALHNLCRIVQREAFPHELKSLTRGVTIHSSSALIPLSPFVDDSGLMRVGGRLDNSQLPYNAQHPILLPSHHILTELIIKREHIRGLHAGLQGTMAMVRQRFWPLALRSTTRKIIRHCIPCLKQNPTGSEAQMGALPRPRVTPSRPFSHCGVDYAGPIIVRESKRRNARNYKAYICIFICFATKAIHIEIVSDMTTEAFLACLKRFIARRGAPSAIYSDNGTTFVGASRQLLQFYDEFLKREETQNIIAQFLNNVHISRQLIPPNAPYFGGLWEAAVKSTKRHLTRVIEELQTILCEVEAILNSRPLTALSSDPNDLGYITPGHFLIGDAMSSFPCHDLADINENRLVRWQRVEQLRQQFWRRWSSEYLNELQQRKKWMVNRGTQLEVGQVVLIKQQGLPPLQWILGRIMELHPGKDGVARSATLKTVKGTLVRPLTKMCIMPVN